MSLPWPSCWKKNNYVFQTIKKRPGNAINIKRTMYIHKLLVDCPWIIKVFRYSFFGTIPIFLNRLSDSPFLVRTKWNLQYLLVLDWTLARFTFCENRYFHDNDKQKTSKTLKLKFSAIQISLWKANTNILNFGVWQTKYTRTKNSVCLFWSKSQKHFHP